MSETHPSEEFRPIEGFPGYEVSNWGRVRSCLLPGSRLRGRGYSDKWHFLKPQNGPQGYLTVGLRDENRHVQWYIHHLVLKTFVGPRPPGKEVRHLDGNKKNAALWNLAWGTKKENEADKLAHGTIRRGESNPLAKLRAADVIEIRRLYASGVRMCRLGRLFGIRHGHIGDIVKRKAWAHIA